MENYVWSVAVFKFKLSLILDSFLKNTDNCLLFENRLPLFEEFKLCFECGARRIGLWTRRIQILACFAILLSQENRTECQDNRPGHQENRENDHSMLSFECIICKKRILSLFCYSPEPGE